MHKAIQQAALPSTKEIAQDGQIYWMDQLDCSLLALQQVRGE